MSTYPKPYPNNVYLVTLPEENQILGVYGCSASALAFIDSTFGLANFEESVGEAPGDLVFVPTKDPTGLLDTIFVFCTPLDDVASDLYV